MSASANRKKIYRPNHEVLLLNANHRPIYTITLRRSLKLIESNKAYIIEHQGILNSPSLSVKRPVIVALKEYRQIPEPKFIPINRKVVSLRDNHLCQYCGESGETIDHVIPKSKGGRHTWENIVLCCKSCNSKKGDKLLHELNWKLVKLPKVPEILRVRIEVMHYESWERYIVR